MGTLTREEARCPCCGEIKTLSAFGTNRSRKSGRSPYCKECRKIQGREWRERYPEKAKAAVKKCQLANPEITLRWKKEHPEKRKEIQRKYYMSHKDAVLAKTREWERKNPEKYREIVKRRHEKEYRTPKGKINVSISVGIRQGMATSKAGRHWESLVGYTVDQLQRHLEKQFKTGMDWENYGKYGWHIDHIIPIAAFNFNNADDLDFKRCWDLKNLQPLWAHENLTKSDKVERPFQPSLAMNV